MGFLDNTGIVTIDAILTKKGREYLAKGQGFEIVKFAIADDEIDYGLWTPTHPLGTAFYGSIIENMPLVEASPDETQVMRYKLVTLPRGTKQIPIISLGVDSIVVTAGTTVALPIRPSTTNGLNGPGFGYTAILYDANAGTLVGTGLAETSAGTVPTFLGDTTTANAVVSRGLEFAFTPKDVLTQLETSLTVIGNETGATITVPVIVKPKPIV
jgi:hypothetical protein